MKLFLVGFFVAICSAAKLDNTYLPPGNARTAGGSGNFLATPRGNGFGGGSSFGGSTTFGSKGTFGSTTSFKSSGFGGSVNSPANVYGGHSGGGSSTGPQIPILKLNNENFGDGSYRFEYETGNGIQAQEAGQLKPGGQEEINDVHGSFAYTGDDGQHYEITYTADENGFQPQGAHLPTPPPIPDEILKSLEQNAADEARGIVDDGSYNNAAHGGGSYNGGGGSYNVKSSTHSGSFGGNFGGNFGGKTGGFGGATNKQYLAPNKPSFNSNTGYNY